MLNKAHVSYVGMHWISGAIAVAAASLLLLRSPFPRWLRLSLPFTYFLLFQYSVVARNYVLAPLLLFAIAAMWRRSPLVMAILLGLLANVALHTAVISAGLALVYVVERIRNADVEESLYRRQLLFGAAILLGFYAIMLWTAWPPHDLALSRVRGETRPFLSYAIVSLVSGVCQPWPLSIPFWGAIAICLRARRGLLYLLPVLFFACLSGAVYANWWHVGLLIPLVICVLWITWPEPGSIISSYETIGRTAMLVMVATQILWSAYALAYDHSHAYSPDLAAAQFLRPFVGEGATIAVTYLDQPEGNQAYDSVGLQPYFDHDIFMNQPNSFWSWSASNPTEGRFVDALRSHPRIVVAEIREPHGKDPMIQTHPKAKLLADAGYRLTNAFCGARPERFEVRVDSCHLIFTPVAGP
jgi:hypothetical protein